MKPKISHEITNRRAGEVAGVLCEKPCEFETQHSHKMKAAGSTHIPVDMMYAIRTSSMESVLHHEIKL